MYRWQEHEKTGSSGLHSERYVIYPQLLPGVQAHNTVVVEPLLVADAVCIQIVVLDGGHGVSCKPFIPPFQKQDGVPPCAIELHHDRPACGLRLQEILHNTSVIYALRLGTKTYPCQACPRHMHE